MRGCGNEAVLGRPPRAAAGGHRRRPAPGRGGPPLRYWRQHDQAVAQATPGDRRRDGQTPAGTAATGGSSSRVRARRSGPGRSRCHAGRALRPVGRGHWHPRQHGDHVAGAAASGLAAQKKSLIAAERNQADLIFVDETSTHTALTRRRARAPRGERAVGRVPRNHGPNVTLLAALTPTGIGPALTIAGAVDGAAFALYAEQVLAPTLRPGQIVVLDNLSAHKSADARTAVEAVGARLLFLPAYSPDFNPIELAFAKVKEHLRAAAERTSDGLVVATATAIDSVTATDARAFYAHCGFPLQPD